MKPIAIVYTSNTGHTMRYAKLLGAKTDLPTYTLERACHVLEKGDPVIYLGWLFADMIKGYPKAAKRFDVRAAVGVGLSPNGAMAGEVRAKNGLAADAALFTVQGGMDLEALKGINKIAISLLTRSLLKKGDDRTPADNAQIKLLQEGGDFVCEENLADVLAWWSAQA